MTSPNTDHFQNSFIADLSSKLVVKYKL